MTIYIILLVWIIILLLSTGYQLGRRATIKRIYPKMKKIKSGEKNR